MFIFSKKPAKSRQQAELCLLFNPENECNKFFQNVQWLSADYMV
jgi:hypothetical protein